MPAAGQRYNMRNDAPEGWTVFDVWTGWPAKIYGLDQTELSMEDADDLVDLLNGLHEKGHQLTELGPGGDLPLLG